MKPMFVIMLVAVALVVVGGALAAQEAATPTEEVGYFTGLMSMAPMGCENYCFWCEPINGDGSCTSGGSCC